MSTMTGIKSSKTGIIVVRLASLAVLMWLCVQYPYHEYQIKALVGDSWLTVVFAVLFVLILGLVAFIVKRRHNDSPTLALAFITFGLALWMLFTYHDRMVWGGWPMFWLMLGVLVVLGLIAVNVLIGTGYYDHAYQVVRRRTKKTTVTNDPTPDPIAPAPGPSTTA